MHSLNFFIKPKGYDLIIESPKIIRNFVEFQLKINRQKNMEDINVKNKNNRT